jgi:hypothetical protein
MRNVPITLISTVDTATVTSAAVDASQIVSASFQFSFGDASVAGTATVQVSNDPPMNGLNGEGLFVPTHWTNYATPTTITAGASVQILIPQSAYRWLRAVFTYTSGGSSTIICNMTGTYL